MPYNEGLKKAAKQYQFKKGQCPNPGGRPKALIKQLVNSESGYTQEFLNKYKGLAKKDVFEKEWLMSLAVISFIRDCPLFKPETRLLAARVYVPEKSEQSPPISYNSHTLIQTYINLANPQTVPQDVVVSEPIKQVTQELQGIQSDMPNDANELDKGPTFT